MDIVRKLPRDGAGLSEEEMAKFYESLTDRLNFLDRNQYIFGREYLHALHKKIMTGPSSNPKFVFSGDSTTEGSSITDPTNKIDQVIAYLSGFYLGSSTTINAGHSGETTSQWLSTRLATDIASTPDCYIWRWGMNDFGIAQAGGAMTRDEVAELIDSNMREGFLQYRASLPTESSSVVIMSPLGMSDPAHWRDADASELINQIMRKVARDFQCCFIDTYSILRDVYQAFPWMDEPFATVVNAGSFIIGTPYQIISIGTTDFTTIGSLFNTGGTEFVATGPGSGSGTAYDTSHVHPEDVGNLWIGSVIFDTILPEAVRKKYGTGNIVNRTAAAGMGLGQAAYNYGMSLYRALDFPINGVALGFKHAANVLFQINHSFTGSPKALFRIDSAAAGVPTAWQAVGMWNPSSTEESPLASALPDTYRKELACHRVTAANGWLAEGAVLTVNQFDGPTLQINFSNQYSFASWRTSNGNTWTDWLILGGTTYKPSTGDPLLPNEGQTCVNTFDNNYKVYADGIWRTLATW